MKEKLVIIGFAFLALILSGCPGKVIDSEELMKADKITYKFKDSSVPPEYHRSYTIDVTKTEAKIVVDSYGNVINNAEIKLKNGQFTEILEAIKSGKITIYSGNIESDGGCSGGTSEYLKVLENQSVIIDGNVYNCGSDKYGNMSGDLKVLSTKLKGLFPDFEKILKR